MDTTYRLQGQDEGLNIAAAYPLPPAHMRDIKPDHGTRTPVVSPEDLPSAAIRAARVTLKLCLYRTELGLTAPTMLSEDHQDAISNQVRYIEKYAQQDWQVRRWVGGSFDVWQDYQTCIDEALISMIPRMFLAPPVDEIPYQSATEFMCTHSPYLIRDLERINDLLLVARTLIVLNQTAQEYVVRSGTDQRVLRLFEICLRVCARSNDSDPAHNTEAACTAIVGICKTLLSTTMTLLNTLTASNPARMLCFWVDLFMRDTTEHLGLEAEMEAEVFGERARGEFAANLEPTPSKGVSSPSPYELDRALVALGICQRADIDRLEEPEKRREAIRQVHSQLHSVLEENGAASVEPSNRKLDPISGDCKDSPRYARDFPRAIDDLFKWIRASCPILSDASPRAEREQAHVDARRVLVEDLQMAAPKMDRGLAPVETDISPPTQPVESSVHTPNQAEQVAADVHTPHGFVPPTAPLAMAPPIHSEPGAEDDEYSDEEDDDDDDLSDDDERDPYGEAFRRRGIISELPLVLSPNDITPLCVILQNAVWLDKSFEEYDASTRIFKAIQCHILVTQETGKNLLREVLIFVAAWDLTEGDLAYSLIAEVMEAVLYHGLMPIAWDNYRESKDVVSPAQSIIVKVLGLIFRQRRKGESPRKSPPDYLELDELPHEFAFDRGIIETLLSDFRSVVVPQTVGLIWLQGQVRQRASLAEDFPLNYWEMERVYEGIYQFLELFAVLTETPAWKELFVRHELSFELIALLRELENCIPKMPVKLPSLDNPTPSPLPQSTAAEHPQRTESQAAAGSEDGGLPGSIPVAVERPYETSPLPGATQPAPLLSPDARLSPGQETLEEAEEASEFPWRNLKKLVVLVLGSLAYKNPVVKTQVRELGGVELIMKCFEYDEHNPYIREHAVLCLNFLLERSPENQAVAMDAGAVRGPSPTN